MTTNIKEMFNSIKNNIKDFMAYVSFMGLKNALNLDKFKNITFNDIKEYVIKEQKRFKQAGALVACSVLLIVTVFEVNSTMNANGLAGISALTAKTGDASVSGSNVVSTADSDSNYGYTNLGVCTVEGNLNVRESASETASIVGKMPEHAGMEILGQEGSWYKIKSGNCEGYVSADYVVTGDEATKLGKEYSAYMATVTADVLMLREEASTESTVLLRMPKGEQLEIEEELGDWIKVTVDSTTGYCAASYVTCAVELPKAQTMKELTFGQGVSDTRVSLVNFATQFVGNKYVWGGTSLTKGADCSGFVMSVFAHYGVSLPRTSRAQANAGVKISASEAQPGDLFFYGNGKSINHVAIYMGGGRIVHASNARTGIKISNAYYRTPVKVVRVLSN